MHESKFLCFVFFFFVVLAGPLRAEEAFVSVANEACELQVSAQEQALPGVPTEPAPAIEQELRRLLADAESPDLWSNIFIVVRLSCNSAGIAYGLTEASQVPLATALPIGVAMGVLSAAQQLVHAQLTHWQTRHGWLPSRDARPASFFEAFFLKEYSLHVLYLQALYGLQKAFGLKENWMTFEVFQAAGLSLMSDGFLNVANTKATDVRIAALKERLEEKAKLGELSEKDFLDFSKSVRKTWTWSRARAVGISFTATVLALLYLEKVGWAGPSLQGLGAVGFGLSAYLFRGEISRYVCALRMSKLGSLFKK